MYKVSIQVMISLFIVPSLSQFSKVKLNTNIESSVHFSRKPTSILSVLTLSCTLMGSIPCVNAVEAPYLKSSTGIVFYDYKIGDGISPVQGDKITFHYKGRLAGRQGWVYDDTKLIGQPVRLTLGVTPCIKGLEIGILGDTNSDISGSSDRGNIGGGNDNINTGGNGDRDSINSMPAMRAGGRRRLVIPAKLGYTDKVQLPVPADFGQQQRLYSTVLNPVRRDREAEALGDSLAGIVVMDVELLRVKKP